MVTVLENEAVVSDEVAQLRGGGRRNGLVLTDVVGNQPRQSTAYLHRREVQD